MMWISPDQLNKLLKKLEADDINSLWLQN